jgi:hypothetical protein
MGAYMIEVSFRVRNEAFFAAIPRQRAYISQLLTDRSILSYSLSDDKRQMWITLMVDRGSQLDKIMDNMPLRPWMIIKVSSLFFNHTSEMKLPAISLN